MGRLDVTRHGGEIEALHQGEGVGQARLVLALEARLNPPEHVGHEDHVAPLGQLLGQAAHVVVDAEDFLEEEDAGSRSTLGDGAEGIETRTLRAGDGLVPGRHAHEPTVAGRARAGGVLAQRIRRLALENNIPIVERKPLAQLLYKEVDIGKPIPTDAYASVAEVLAYVYQLKGKKLPMPPRAA